MGAHRDLEVDGGRARNGSRTAPRARCGFAREPRPRRREVADHVDADRRAAEARLHDVRAVEAHLGRRLGERDARQRRHARGGHDRRERELVHAERGPLDRRARVGGPRRGRARPGACRPRPDRRGCRARRRRARAPGRDRAGPPPRTRRRARASKVSGSAPLGAPSRNAAASSVGSTDDERARPSSSRWRRRRDPPRRARALACSPVRMLTSCSGAGPPNSTATWPTSRLLGGVRGRLRVVVGQVVLVEDGVAVCERAPHPLDGALPRRHAHDRRPALRTRRAAGRRGSSGRRRRASAARRAAAPANASFSVRCRVPSSTIPGVTTTRRPSTGRLRQQLERRARARGVRVERVVDDEHAGRSARDGQPVRDRRDALDPRRQHAGVDGRARRAAASAQARFVGWTPGIGGRQGDLLAAHDDPPALRDRLDPHVDVVARRRPP